MRILGTNYCGEMHQTDFKCCELFQDLICRCDYAERVVEKLVHQIQSENYVGNRSVSIEGIALEHFSALPQTDINSTPPSHQQHEEFHSFLSDDSK